MTAFRLPIGPPRLQVTAGQGYGLGQRCSTGLHNLLPPTICRFDRMTIEQRRLRRPTQLGLVWRPSK